MFLRGNKKGINQLPSNQTTNSSPVYNILHAKSRFSHKIAQIINFVIISDICNYIIPAQSFMTFHDTKCAVMRENRSLGLPTMSDTNRPVQLQKMDRSLKFRI